MIENFIACIRNIDPMLSFIFKNGACYRFAKYIKAHYPSSLLYISDEDQHVIVKYKNAYYDIDGKRSGDGYRIMSVEDMNKCADWSFYKNFFAGKECPNCGEIIT